MTFLPEVGVSVVFCAVAKPADAINMMMAAAIPFRMVCQFLALRLLRRWKSDKALKMLDLGLGIFCDDEDAQTLTPDLFLHRKMTQVNQIEAVML